MKITNILAASVCLFASALVFAEPQAKPNEQIERIHQFHLKLFQALWDARMDMDSGRISLAALLDVCGSSGLASAVRAGMGSDEEELKRSKILEMKEDVITENDFLTALSMRQVALEGYDRGLKKALRYSGLENNPKSPLCAYGLRAADDYLRPIVKK